jgi:hypothetical protein
MRDLGRGACPFQWSIRARALLFASKNGNGKYGVDSLTHAKSVLISPADVDIDYLLPPYTPEKVEALNQWFDY